jgi:hypothetical protein
MAKDVDLFAAAMSGVKPLKGRKQPAVAPRPEAEGPLKPPERSPAARGMTKEPELTPDDQVSTTTVTAKRVSEYREEDLIGPYGQPQWTAVRRFPTTRVYVRR